MPVYTNEPSQDIEDLKKLLSQCIWKGLSAEQMVGLGFRDEKQIRLLCDQHSLNFNHTYHMKHLHDCMTYCSTKGYTGVYQKISNILSEADGDVSRLDGAKMFGILHKICDTRRDDVCCRRFILRCIWDGINTKDAASLGGPHMILFEEEVNRLCLVYGIRDYEQAANFVRKNKTTFEYDEWLQLVEMDPTKITKVDFGRQLMNWIWQGLTPDEVIQMCPRVGRKTKLKRVCKEHGVSFTQARFMRAIYQKVKECDRMNLTDVGRDIRNELKSAGKNVSNINVPRVQKLMQKVHKQLHKTKRNNK